MQRTTQFLVLIPALCLCLTLLVAGMHYLHWIANSEATLYILYSVLTLDVIASALLLISTSGYGAYVFMSALMFFIVFVFSLATVTHQGPAPQRSATSAQVRTLATME
ncbi:hypothetical protein [Shewanella sp. GXUN23E]|uniref:hypothetical protein n=1 Tax=Shewanella sp. GXUN23E TaxID=3422498 RepID=UPI003D7E6F12